MNEEEEKLIEEQPRIDINDVLPSSSALEQEVEVEQLGSELSGCSVEIPDEVIDIEKSANYLTAYDRDYKSKVLIAKRGIYPVVGRRFP